MDLQKESALPAPDIDNFDGTDLLKFPLFMKNFRMLVEKGTNNPKRRLELLLKFTKGEAHQLIKECILLDDPTDAYDLAMKLLQKDYGNPVILATTYKRRAEGWKQLSGGDKEGLRKFAIFVNSLQIVKQSNP